MKLLRPLDDWLNDITMYRLIVYGLGLLAAVSVFFAVAHKLSLSAVGMLTTLVVLVAVCYVINRTMALLWEVGTNSESWLITALIMFFVLAPATGIHDGLIIALAAVIAMASKYVIAWHHKQIFNPAAIAVAAVGVSKLAAVTWWVGSPALLPFTLLLGVLIVRKVRRWQMVLAFGLAALVVMEVVGLAHQHSALNNLTTLVASWPLVFLGTIMLTEPSTQPPRTKQQIIYGAIVGAIFTAQTRLLGLVSTPEMALIIGNIYSFTVSPKFRLRLNLAKKTQLSEHVWDFSFKSPRTIEFLPGQYLEWTLPHRHTDGRGNRRSFTIASAPTESELHIGVKFYDPSSSFKRALTQMKLGSDVMAGQLSGSFTMPTDSSRKLAFIAGGIGITPFRSMIKHLIDQGEKRDIVLFYSVSDPEELSYLDTVKAGAAVGVKLIKVCDKPPAGWDGQAGFINEAMIKSQLPDFAQRRFYLSGPNAMVTNYRQLLISLGIQRRNIVTDYFPGY